MRLWHQSRTELARLPKYAAAMQEHFKRVGQPDTVVDLHGLAPSTYVTEYPGYDNRYVYFAYLHSLQILQNVQTAEREGYDGFLIMNLPENIVGEAQSLVNIPVVSYAQAAMYTAAMLGRRFAILTMIDEYIPLYEQHIAKFGMQSRAWGVQSLGQDYKTVFEAFDKPGPVSLHCDIHEHMHAVILVLETPYFVRTDLDGNYRIEGLPAGHYTLKAWVSSKTTYERPVDLKSGSVIHADFP